jgi:hypothetical protein
MKKNRIGIALYVLALANFANAFRVTPARLDLIIARGTTQEVVLVLLGSKSEKPESLMVFATDISMMRNGSLKFDRLEEYKYSAVPWIKFEQTKYALLEKQAKELKFKISVPTSADPGEYYSVVMVEPTEFSDIKAKDKPLNLQMKSRLAVVIVIDVPGRIYEKKGAALSTSVQEENGKLKIISAFNNTGNIHLDVTGRASIRSKDGKTRFGQTKLMALGTNKEEAFIFPGNIRDYEGVIDKPLPKGEYICDVIFDYGNKVKKATASSPFSISRAVNIDESKNEFLGLESKHLELVVPAGALRTKVLKVSNVDYRSIQVSVASDSWVEVEPKSFSLQPGESKNIKATFSMSEYKQPIVDTRIVFKPDRGMSSVAIFSLSEKAKVSEKTIKRSI